MQDAVDGGAAVVSPGRKSFNVVMIAACVVLQGASLEFESRNQASSWLSYLPSAWLPCGGCHVASAWRSSTMTDSCVLPKCTT